MAPLLFGLERALYQSNRLQVYINYLAILPPTLARENLESCLVEFYALILQFLGKAIRIYQRGSVARGVDSFWRVEDVSSFGDECNKMANRVEIEAINCDRYLSTVSGIATAASRGDREVVTLLLDKGADVNTQDGEYGSALQAAASTGDREIVTLLLDKGADVNAQGGFHGSALQAAASTGDREIVTLLLDKGADVNTQGGKYGSALQAAASTGDREIVTLLLDKGADVNAQGGFYGSALQAAVSTGDREIVTLLLDKGADVNAQGGFHGNALQAAAYGGSLGIVQLLLARGVDVTIQPWIVSRASLLHAGAFGDNYDLVKLLMGVHLDIHNHLETQDNSGQTPLHIAVEKRNLRIAECFLDKGASPDVADFGNVSPFQRAVQIPDLAMALLLLPRSEWGLSRMSASDWRHFLASERGCHLEMICGKPAQLLVRADNLELELENMSYPLSNSDELPAREADFVSRQEYGKRLL